MASYVVMEPPAASDVQAVDRAVLVRDSFSFMAFVMPFIWLLWHRLWIEAVLTLVASIALVAFADAIGLGSAGGLLSLLVSLYVALEGRTMKINALRRRGWHEWGVVEGGNMAEAEIRYLTGLTMNAPRQEAERRAIMPSIRSTEGAATIAQPVPSGPALGLLGYPGRH